MKVLNSKRYKELIDTENKIKFYKNEIKRKEFCIQKRQKTIIRVRSLIKDINKNTKKQELLDAINEIKNIIA